MAAGENIPNICPPALGPLLQEGGTGRILAVEVSGSLGSEVLGGLAPLVRRGQPLYCVDGGNRFDPYVFSLHARRKGCDAEALLDRVFVTRAFTIHQLAAVVGEMLPPLVAPEPPPLLAVLGLDHLFLEETLPVAERRLVLRGVLAGLQRMRALGTALLVTYERPAREEAWWRPMLELGDIQARAGRAGDGSLNFEITRYRHGQNSSDIQYMASAGDRLLAAFSTDVEVRA